VLIFLEISMSWYEEEPELIRGVIQDYDDPPSYDDQRLISLAAIAAFYVLVDINSNAYSIDLVAKTISPDPTDSPSKQTSSFMALTAVKAACLLSGGEAKKAAGQSVAIRDGTSSIALGGRSSAYLALFKYGYCTGYTNLLDKYLIGQYEMVGRAVMGPCLVAPGPGYAFAGSTWSQSRTFRKYYPDG
jgi:hypothetical protein